MNARMLTRAVREPGRAAFRIASVLAPTALWSRYLRLARRQLGRPYLLVSFDCETDRDTAAALEVRESCERVGVPAAFAVPGELIERDPETYRALAATGCELINHGYLQHTEVAPASDVPRTTLEYADLKLKAVVTDLERGDRAHRVVLGRPPTGVRTPHFGGFQGRRELELIHGVAERLGYAYSTSTVPMVGFRYGPAPLVRGGRLVELPLSGSPSWPHLILDSWGYVADPNRAVDADDLERELGVLGDLCRGAGTGIVNVYADPSHVLGWGGFFGVLGGSSDLASTFTEVARHRLGRP